jgi:hypothetical protein
MEGGRFHTAHSATAKAVCAASNRAADRPARRAGTVARRHPRDRARARRGRGALDGAGRRRSHSRRRRMRRRRRRQRRQLRVRRARRPRGRRGDRGQLAAQPR